MEASKVAIIGAGRVGSTFAYTLATSGLVREIVLVDADPARAEGEAMDIGHALPFHVPVRVRAGTPADLAGAMVTVVTAGTAQRPGEPRTALLQRNAAMLRPIVRDVVLANPQGLLLIATNPVDALTFAALRTSGLPPHRVLGSGTVLDSARLRSQLGVHYGLDPRNIHAYVLGEHGDSEFVAWSTATLGNMGLVEYCALSGMSCGPGEMEAIAASVRNAAYEIIRRKGATNFAIAAALTRIVEAVVRDEASVLTVSTLAQGRYTGVCLSLPAVIGRTGVQRILPIPLSPQEIQALQGSARAIRSAVESLDPEALRGG